MIFATMIGTMAGALLFAWLMIIFAANEAVGAEHWLNFIGQIVGVALTAALAAGIAYYNVTKEQRAHRTDLLEALDGFDRSLDLALVAGPDHMNMRWLHLMSAKKRIDLLASEWKRMPVAVYMAKEGFDVGWTECIAMRRAIDARAFAPAPEGGPPLLPEHRDFFQAMGIRKMIMGGAPTLRMLKGNIGQAILGRPELPPAIVPDQQEVSFRVAMEWANHPHYPEWARPMGRRRRAQAAAPAPGPAPAPGDQNG